MEHIKVPNKRLCQIHIYVCQNVINSDKMYFTSSNFELQTKFFVHLQTMIDLILYNTSCLTTLYNADSFEQAYKVLPEDGV